MSPTDPPSRPPEAWPDPVVAGIKLSSERHAMNRQVRADPDYRHGSPFAGIPPRSPDANCRSVLPQWSDDEHGHVYAEFDEHGHLHWEMRGQGRLGSNFERALDRDIRAPGKQAAEDRKLAAVAVESRPRGGMIRHTPVMIVTKKGVVTKITRPAHLRKIDAYFRLGDSRWLPVARAAFDLNLPLPTRLMWLGVLRLLHERIVRKWLRATDPHNQIRRAKRHLQADVTWLVWRRSAEGRSARAVFKQGTTARVRKQNSAFMAMANPPRRPRTVRPHRPPASLVVALAATYTPRWWRQCQCKATAEAQSAWPNSQRVVVCPHRGVSYVRAGRNRITGRWVVRETDAATTARILTRPATPLTKYRRKGQHPVGVEIEAATAKYRRALREQFERGARLTGEPNPTKVKAGTRSGAARQAGRERIEAAIAAQRAAGTPERAIARVVAGICGCTARWVRKAMRNGAPRNVAESPPTYEDTSTRSPSPRSVLRDSEFGKVLQRRGYR
jgi:hypothetical protein